MSNKKAPSYQQIRALNERFLCPVCENKFELPPGFRQPVSPCRKCLATICRPCIFPNGDDSALGRENAKIPCPLCPNPECRKADMEVDEITIIRMRWAKGWTETHEAPQPQDTIVDYDSFSLFDLGNSSPKTGSRHEDIFGKPKSKPIKAKTKRFRTSKRHFSNPASLGSSEASHESGIAVDGRYRLRKPPDRLTYRPQRIEPRRPECEDKVIENRLFPGSLWPYGTKVRKQGNSGWTNGELHEYKRQEQLYVVRWQSPGGGKPVMSCENQFEMSQLVVKKPPN